MSLRTLAFCAVLLSATAGLAVAQTDQSNEQPNEGFGSGQYPQYGQYPVYAQPQYANNQAYQAGFQDGINDGARDLQTNHGFRPTKTEKYEDADRGYTSSLGDKNQYKAIYRQGYTAGYQQGYNGQAAGPYPVYGPPPQAPVYGQPQVYGQPPYGANPGYQNGFQAGLNGGAADRQAGRQFRATDTMDYKFAPGYDKSYGDKDQYKQAYRQGYVTGYQQAYSGAAAPAGAYPPPPAPVYGQSYPAYPPQYPVAAGQPGQAYQIGYQDGLNDGAADRAAGHGFRATKTERYEDAPGYNKSFGDKKQWKNIYRQGYVAGYQQSFGH